MEESVVRERGARGQDLAAEPSSAAAAEGGRGPPLSGQSYWMDLWIMLLIDLLLFVFIYLLP